LKKITIDSKNYKLISSYAEMNQKTFFKVCQIRSQFLFENSQPEGYHAVKMEVFSALSNIPYRKILKINALQWADLLPHIDFVFTDAPDLEKNFLATIKIGGLFGRRFYTSEGFIDKSNLLEFCDADTAFINAGLEESMEPIYKLCAIIYRPKRKDLAEFKRSNKWNGDIREEYNQVKAVDRSKLFRKAPVYKLVAIFLYYWSYRQKELINSPDLKILFEGESKVKGLEIGWLGTMFNISGKNHGTFEQAVQQNWQLILYDIANSIVLAKSQEQARIDETLFNELRNRS
jgi:hypothetical protein